MQSDLHIKFQKRSPSKFHPSRHLQFESCSSLAPCCGYRPLAEAGARGSGGHQRALSNPVSVWSSGSVRRAADGHVRPDLCPRARTGHHSRAQDLCAQRPLPGRSRSPSWKGHGGSTEWRARPPSAAGGGRWCTRWWTVAVTVTVVVVVRPLTGDGDGGLSSLLLISTHAPLCGSLIATNIS